jgi:arabinofuranosyltransferase
MASKKSKKAEPEVVEVVEPAEAAEEKTDAEKTDDVKPADKEEKSPWHSDLVLLLGLAAPIVYANFAMFRTKRFTVDDSYISFRYARNFANGLGLVYNEGERVEGYTNFLWTVLLGIGIKLGLDPDVLAKVLGGGCALGTIGLLWYLGGRFRKYTLVPCLSTWLFATSAPNMGYAVYGLETSLFVFLIFTGIALFFREEDVFSKPHAAVETKVPWSGLAFALAGLTRPEAPMYMGIVMLFLGLGLFSKRNIIRGGIFVAIVGTHLLWRHSYYGAWVPNTLGAKTGNLDGQLHAGWDYFTRWRDHTGPIVYLWLASILYALWVRSRPLLAISALSVCVVGYVVLVGGDWMQNFRFLVPFEPLAFLLIDVAARAGAERLQPEQAPKWAFPAAGIAAIGFMAWRGQEQNKMHRHLLATEDRFWRMAAGGTAKLFLEQPKGLIAIGDIGYVGYKTDYPILDLLGLVDPEIPKMPGGYTQKTGKEWLDYFYARKPRYAILISSSQDCEHPSVHGSVVMWRDRRFRETFRKLTFQPLDNNFAWCIYERKDARPAEAAPAPVPSEPAIPLLPASASAVPSASAAPRPD